MSGGGRGGTELRGPKGKGWSVGRGADGGAGSKERVLGGRLAVRGEMWGGTGTQF